ncbi:MAG: hypothetical protein ACK5WS_05840 [Alphaproteobacteria bacterium]|jgi:hypothetical protein|nr:hypothetical protein [Candidatus Jidaibacter sp.]
MLPYIPHGIFAAASWLSVPCLAYVKDKKSLEVLKQEYLTITALDILSTISCRFLENYLSSQHTSKSYYNNIFFSVGISKIPLAPRLFIYKSFSKALLSTGTDEAPSYHNKITTEALTKLFQICVDDLSSCIVPKHKREMPDNRLGFNIIESYFYKISIAAMRQACHIPDNTPWNDKALVLFGEVSTTCLTESIKTFMWYSNEQDVLYSLAKIMAVKASICIASKLILEPLARHVRNKATPKGYEKYGESIEKFCIRSIKTSAFRSFKSIEFHHSDNAKTI